MEIKVTQFQAPIVATNYETLKAELLRQLENYKGLVVTEDTLGGCKTAQKELAGLRNKIDTFRKDTKRELEKPIKKFEEQCKELISLVDTVEQPIKEGIKVYDDQKREEKRQQALELIAEVAAEQGLNEKYAAQLTVIDKYTNLTATKKAVREDLETRAFALSVEQAREAERLEVIKSVLESENSRLQTKLDLSLVQHDIDTNVATSRIIEKIKGFAARVYEAENKPAEPPKEQQPTETPAQAENPPETAQAQPEKQYTATLKLVGTLAELRSVSAFIKQHGISYTVLDQREV